MRKAFCVLLVLLLMTPVTANALEGQVVYLEDAEDFIFLPGTEYSPTDLFPDLKNVMPGDTLTQRILVKNDASNDYEATIYMRSLGAQEGSEEFLSQLRLTVQTAGEAVLFEAPANETAQLTDWVSLGTLQPGGEVELLLTLEVPTSLDNTFKNLIGYLDWEFAVEKIPVIPPTGDEAPLLLWGVTALVCACGLIGLAVPAVRRRRAG